MEFVKSEKKFFGHLDQIIDARLIGWCSDLADPDGTVSVDVWINGRVVATIAADVYREDLQRQGIGNGRHGFEFDVTPFLQKRGPYHARVTISGFDLIGSPRASFWFPGGPRPLLAPLPHQNTDNGDVSGMLRIEPDYIGHFEVLSVEQRRGNLCKGEHMSEPRRGLDDAVCAFPSKTLAMGDYCTVRLMLRGRTGYHANLLIDLRALEVNHNICGFAFVEIRIDGEAVYRKDAALCASSTLSFHVGRKDRMVVELTLLARRDCEDWTWSEAVRYGIAGCRFHGHQQPLAVPDHSSDPTDRDLALLRASAAQRERPFTVIFPSPSVPWTFMRQRPQQLAIAFAERGHTVVYLGRENESLTSSTPVQRIRPNLFLINDAEFQFIHPLALFGSQERDYVIVQYWPHQHDCVQKLKALLPAALVYDCVDDHEVFSPYDRIEHDHKHALQTADVVCATAMRLLEKIKAARPDVIFLPNGVRLEDYDTAPIRDPEVAEMRRKHKIIIGYYGALAEWIDWKLIRAIATHRPQWTLWLTGVAYGDIVARERLLDYPNIVIWPQQPYERILEIVKAYDVAIIPFRLNELTHSVSPVKLFEYAAARRRIVSTAMQEVVASGLAQIGHSLKQIIDLIEEGLLESYEMDEPPSYPGLEQHSWDARVLELEERLRAFRSQATQPRAVARAS